MILGGLVVPMSLVGNVRLTGETVTATKPVPDNAIDCGLEEELLATVNVAIRFPRADGANVTVILQLNPAGSVLGVIGQFPPNA